MGILIDFVQERLNQARANMQPQPHRVMYLREPQKPRAVALFGASPDGFGLDWVTYRTPKLNGPGVQPLQAEMKVIDSDVDAWKGPNPNLPAMVSHGKALNYEHISDQRPVVGHDVTPVDVWDGQVRAMEPKKSLETSARTPEKTVGDEIALQMKKEKYWFLS